MAYIGSAISSRESFFGRDQLRGPNGKPVFARSSKDDVIYRRREEQLDLIIDLIQETARINQHYQRQFNRDDLIHRRNQQQKLRTERQLLARQKREEDLINLNSGYMRSQRNSRVPLFGGTLDRRAENKFANVINSSRSLLNIEKLHLNHSLNWFKYQKAQDKKVLKQLEMIEDAIEGYGKRSFVNRMTFGLFGTNTQSRRIDRRIQGAEVSRTAEVQRRVRNTSSAAFKAQFGFQDRRVKEDIAEYRALEEYKQLRWGIATGNNRTWRNLAHAPFRGLSRVLPKALGGDSLRILGDKNRLRYGISGAALLRGDPLNRQQDFSLEAGAHYPPTRSRQGAATILPPIGRVGGQNSGSRRFERLIEIGEEDLDKQDIQNEELKKLPGHLGTLVRNQQTANTNSAKFLNLATETLETDKEHLEATKYQTQLLHIDLDEILRELKKGGRGGLGAAAGGLDAGLGLGGLFGKWGKGLGTKGGLGRLALSALGGAARISPWIAMLMLSGDTNKTTAGSNWEADPRAERWKRDALMLGQGPANRTKDDNTLLNKTRWERDVATTRNLQDPLLHPSLMNSNLSDKGSRLVPSYDLTPRVKQPKRPITPTPKNQSGFPYTMPSAERFGSPTPSTSPGTAVSPPLGPPSDDPYPIGSKVLIEGDMGYEPIEGEIIGGPRGKHGHRSIKVLRSNDPLYPVGSTMRAPERSILRRTSRATIKTGVQIASSGSDWAQFIGATPTVSRNLVDANGNFVSDGTRSPAAQNSAAQGPKSRGSRPSQKMRRRRRRSMRAASIVGLENLPPEQQAILQSMGIPYTNSNFNIPGFGAGGLGGGGGRGGGGNDAPYTNPNSAAPTEYEAPTVRREAYRVDAPGSIIDGQIRYRTVVDPGRGTAPLIPGSTAGIPGTANAFTPTNGIYRPKYNLTDADLSNAVVNTIAGEARLSDPKSVDAVINNMMNRVGTKAYGPSGNLQEVAAAPGQYAGYNRGRPNAQQAEYIRSRIKAIASGTEADITGGANEFRTATYRGPWYHNNPNGVDIGGNRFAYNAKADKGTYAPYSKPQSVSPNFKSITTKSAVPNMPSTVMMQSGLTYNSNSGSNSISGSRVQMANSGPNQIRNRPVQDKIRDVYDYAAQAAGVDKVVVTSGGQTSERNPLMYKKPGGWTGSHRHDEGGAGDIKLYKDGRALNFNNPNDRPYFEAFARESAKAGATGIGAGNGYMGGETMHVGFGKEATWGGASWLNPAVQAGRAQREGFDLSKWKNQQASPSDVSKAYAMGDITLKSSSVGPNSPLFSPNSMARFNQFTPESTSVTPSDAAMVNKTPVSMPMAPPAPQAAPKAPSMVGEMGGAAKKDNDASVMPKDYSRQMEGMPIIHNEIGLAVFNSGLA